MIELTIAYPRQEVGSAELLIITVEHRGVNKSKSSPTDLRPAIGYISEALWDSLELLTFPIGSTGDIAITYDPEFTPWRTWYIGVIDAIMKYYRENFFRVVASEVVHHIEAYSDLAA